VAEPLGPGEARRKLGEPELECTCIEPPERMRCSEPSDPSLQRGGCRARHAAAVTGDEDIRTRGHHPRVALSDPAAMPGIEHVCKPQHLGDRVRRHKPVAGCRAALQSSMRATRFRLRATARWPWVAALAFADGGKKASQTAFLINYISTTDG
jgi:hypothetical protein